VFAGHVHQMTYGGVRDGIEYFTLATTGGSLLKNGKPKDGYLHHFNLVNVRRRKVSVAAVPIGQIIDPRTQDIRVLARQGFLIKSEQTRTLEYPFKVPNISSDKMTIHVGITHAADNSGDDGLTYQLVDALNRNIKDGFIKETGTFWFKHKVRSGSSWKLILHDLDTSFEGKYPGNGGFVEVILKPDELSKSSTDAGSILKSVRVAYLVSSDRKVRNEYKKAIERAARDVQKWYARQMGGKTFKLNTPVVEVVHSDQKATWFTSNPTGENKDNFGFFNTLSEMKRLKGTKTGADEYIWVVYSDGPGNKGRGLNGFTYLPEDDLLGLVGKHPKYPNKKRWIGGLGHELGHALGLDHPKDTEKHENALMRFGYYNYPDNCYLTPGDKRILGRSPFVTRRNR